MLSIALYMVGGFVFASTNFGGQYILSSEARELTVVVLILSTTSTAALGLWVLLSDIRHYYDGIYNEGVIQAFSVGTWMKASVAVSASFCNEQDMLEFINGANASISTGTGVIEPAAMLQVLLRHSGLQLSEDTSPGAQDESVCLEATALFLSALTGHGDSQDSCFGSCTQDLPFVGQPAVPSLEPRAEKLLGHLYLQPVSAT